jgi:Rifampin ADP-ribosyl transferase
MTAVCLVQYFEPMTMIPEHDLAARAPKVFAQTYFHGTKADLQLGDLVAPGQASNYGQQNTARYVYLSATLDAAIWGAELALGDAPERIYLVEPTGPIEDDPNLTDKKFPGNPTQSYRSTHPFRVVGEVTRWQGHAAAQVQAMRDGLARLRAEGVEAIED